MPTGSFDPLVLRLILTYDCVFQCEHCKESAGPGQDESMDMDDMVEFIRTAYYDDVSALHLSGGEPFLVRDKLVQALETGTEKNMNISVESAWLGEEYELEVNARLLRDHNAIYVTSLSAFQQNSAPEGMNYIEHKVKSLKTLFEHDVPVLLNIPDCIENERQNVQIFSNVILRGLGGKIKGRESREWTIIETPYGKFHYRPEKIQHIGRAYGSVFTPVHRSVGDAEELHCPRFPEKRSYINDYVETAVIRPDGIIQACPNMQRGVDPKHGNVNDRSWKDICHRTSWHPLLYGSYACTLRTFSINQEFYKGTRKGLNGCELCNMYFRERKERPDLDEMAGVDRLDQSFFE